MSDVKYVMAIIVIFAVLCFFPTILNRIKKRKCTACTVGKVVRVLVSRSRTNHKVHTLYTPVVEYEANGRIYTEQYYVSSSFHEYNEGENVKVRYDPENPADFFIDDYKSLKNFLSIIIVILFVVMIFIANQK